jgi:hypothetical protein
MRLHVLKIKWLLWVAETSIKYNTLLSYFR